MSKEHREALAALEWGLLHESSGFTVLVGEVGTGKTTLVMAVLTRPHRDVRAAYVSNSKLSFEEMMKIIIDQLGVRAQGRTKFARLETLNQFLSALKSGERVVIIVDEAQGLSDETLEQLRLLSNRERADEKQLHFVLVGQPELLHRLGAPALRQLNQRVGARSILNPLERAEAYEYVEQRLRATGGTTKRIFEPSALRLLVRRSGGIPRRINVLCHNAMLLAYSASTKTVATRMVRAAVAEYDNLFSMPKRSAGSNGTGARITRWLSRIMEVCALRLLEWSRSLNPETRAYGSEPPAELLPDVESQEPAVGGSEDAAPVAAHGTLAR